MTGYAARPFTSPPGKLGDGFTSPVEFLLAIVRRASKKSSREHGIYLQNFNTEDSQTFSAIGLHQV